MVRELLVLISMILLILLGLILTFICFNYSILSGIIILIVSAFVNVTYIWACMLIFDGGE